MERTGHRDQRRTIVLPQRTLLVLCGPAGSGKSTFSQRFVHTHQQQDIRNTSVVSSDFCRALVCDDEANQQVNRDSFDLFHYIIHKRMLQARFTLADSTALTAEARHRLLGVARQHQYHTCLLIFNLAPHICIQQDQTRQRVVGEQIINFHATQLQQALQEIPQEGWNQVHLLAQQDITTAAEDITIIPDAS